ncbi:MAG: hypothetical protein OSB43_18455 [Nocardioides sp.]|uniref:hypothetical protein n=1 Tax=Nocardioides sp. TaxID=35761 RepID=UPI00239F7038|nr:hypothetical protein [Nocardioides sp.]MDE0778266.1 hypothetical protein [Nocardioides sp.]
MIVPSWQETFLDLHAAQTPEELWIVLLVPHGIRSSSAWEEPYLLFRHFHLEVPTDAATTALLLCTDYRWRKATHHLIHELADSGLLDEHALDQLATWFLAADLELKVPRRLFAGAPVVFASSRTDDATRTVELPRPERVPAHSGRRRDADLVDVPRSVWPPLRRWAAAHHLRYATASWSDLVAIADELPSRDAAMILAGVMDAADTIPEGERGTAVDLGLTSGSGIVRLAALPALAAFEGLDAASKRAAADPSEKVRAWAEKASRPNQLSPGKPRESGADQQPSDAEQPPPGDQPTLF